MPIFPIILADADLGKLVFGVVALIFWGVSALASAAKKRQEQERRRLASQPVAPGPMPTPPPLPPVASRAVPRPGPPARRVAAAAPKRSGPIQAVKLPTPPQPPRRGKQKARPAAAPPPPLTRAAPPVAPISAGEVAGGARPAAKAASVDARAVRRWLTPATLRSQFILTEVLQPPLALREPRE